MTGPVDISGIASVEFPAVMFFNPAAGRGRAVASLPRIRKVFEAHAFCADFVPTENAQDLERRAGAAIRTGTRLLLAMGGDGTFQGLANAACSNDVIVGVLPAGGGNDFAAALGLPGDPAIAAEAILKGQPKWVDLVRVRTAQDRVRLYAGGGGVGLDAEAARHASETFRRLPGRVRYVASALRALYGYQPMEVRVAFPGSDLPTIQTRSLLAGVLNTPTYGAGMRLAPEARIDDGWLDAVVVEDLGVLQVLALLPRLLRSGELRTPHLKRVRARSVRLTTDRPCVFHGDGEILGPTPVEIEVVPNALRVLAPTPSLNPGERS